MFFLIKKLVKKKKKLTINDDTDSISRQVI